MGLFSKKKKDPELVQVKGRQLRCMVCDNELFWRKNFQLNTTVLTLFNLDWANRNATCFVCSECTHIIWFDSN